MTNKISRELLEALRQASINLRQAAQSELGRKYPDSDGFKKAVLSLHQRINDLLNIANAAGVVNKEHLYRHSTWLENAEYGVIPNGPGDRIPYTVTATVSAFFVTMILKNPSEHFASVAGHVGKSAKAILNGRPNKKAHKDSEWQRAVLEERLAQHFLGP